jgi:hypothetical protein
MVFDTPFIQIQVSQSLAAENLLGSLTRYLALPRGSSAPHDAEPKAVAGAFEHSARPQHQIWSLDLQPDHTWDCRSVMAAAACW